MAYIDDGDVRDECRELMHSLPKEVGLVGDIYRYQGFWCPPKILQAVLSSQKHLQPRDTDIFLASIPKSGTTWLKALTFAVVNRYRYKYEQHPLLATNPHDLIPFLEVDIYGSNQILDVTNIPSPRIFSTHIPYSLLPRLVVDSGCRVVYIYRNPRDTFVSMSLFFNVLRTEAQGPINVEEALEKFCEGSCLYGPYWDHVLGYWRESIERPDKVLFLKYDEIKQEPAINLKRLAQFIGFPFSPEEEEEGVVDEISRLCSFKNLSSLEVNKKGRAKDKVAADKFFRRGEVGDYVNHLTDAMIERINQMEERHLGDSGLLIKKL